MLAHETFCDIKKKMLLNVFKDLNCVYRKLQCVAGLLVNKLDCDFDHKKSTQVFL